MRELKLIAFFLCFFGIIVDSNAQLKWAFSMNGGTSVCNTGTDIAIDVEGNVVVVGTYKDTLIVNPFDAPVDQDTLISKGSSVDIFVSKYDYNGNYLWSVSFGSGGLDTITSVDIPPGSTNIYLGGGFSGTVDFDPGGGVENLVSSGDLDAFIVKLDEDGAYDRKIKMGDASLDLLNDIKGTVEEDIFFTGFYQGSGVDFGASDSENSVLTSKGGKDILYGKVDRDLAVQYVYGIGGKGEDMGMGIAVDPSYGYHGIIGVLGDTIYNADPSGNGDSTILLPFGNEDVFLATYQSNGTLMKAVSMGSADSDLGYSIDVDVSSNFYVSGTFSGSINLAPLDATDIVTSNGGKDAFIASYDKQLSQNWGHSWGGSSATEKDEIIDLKLDNKGLLNVIGTFNGINTNVDPVGSDLISSAGGEDIVYSKEDANGKHGMAVSLGGTGDEGGNAIAMASDRSFAITGKIKSSSDFDPSGGTSVITPVGLCEPYVAYYDNLGGETGLPVTFIALEAYYIIESQHVEVIWVTATEIDNDYFTVQRSVNGVDFQDIGTRNGAGNSSTTLRYQFFDENPLMGQAYYRIKQTDYNGKASYSDMVEVLVREEFYDQKKSFTIFPNPSNGSDINIKSLRTYLPYEEVFVLVADAAGREIYSRVVLSNDHGAFLTAIDPYDKIPPGVYVVIGSTLDDIYSEILIIEGK